MILVLAATTLPVLLIWLWDQRSAGDPPDRVAVDSGVPVQHVEHRHTNHLIHETSPYLLQHAHNPVNWYPWGNEALAKAKREDKPIFLSVGYSTCYWCHVMEKESFEDDEVARILNEHFVAIKVDREERPDIDEQYMLATQLITRRGGWPNSVWLTPDGRPWMAGTYFPKPQFMQLLTRLIDVWRKQRDEIEQQADALAAMITAVGGGGEIAAGGEITPDLLSSAAAKLLANYEPRYGGFGRAPKFPPHGTLAVLIRRYSDTASGGQDQSLRESITRTLDAMWLGGMHDHLGGGFHRYSTDERWLLPHFEKMLYDNAQLMRAYTDCHRITKIDRYREAVADIFAWVQRDMTSPDGAFYSAIDSGDVGKEGEAYVWHLDEIIEVLGKEDGRLFADVYNVDKHGNFAEESTGKREGTNILHLSHPIDAIAKARGEPPEDFARRLERMRDKLLARRQTWPQPHKDDKVLTSWNGLMIGALAYAGRQLNEPRYTDAATRAATFILDRMMQGDTLLRTYRSGVAKQPGYLDDYAYFGQALVELHWATGDAHWLTAAQRLADTLLRDFQDAEQGGFFFTTANHEDLLMRSRGLTGGGNTPDANGIAATLLLDLAQLTGQERYADAARRTLESLAGIMAQNPYGSEHLLLAAAEMLQPSKAPAAAGDIAVASDARKIIGPVTVDLYASRQAVRPGQRVDIAVAMDIGKGWHLYGQNPEIDFLVPSTVSIEAGPAFKPGEVTVPQPHRMEDPFLKKELNTYTGHIWYRTSVTIAPDAPAGQVDVPVQVRVQACDDRRCLPPETQTLQLTIRVDPRAPHEARHGQVFTTP